MQPAKPSKITLNIQGIVSFVKPGRKTDTSEDSSRNVHDIKDYIPDTHEYFLSFLDKSIDPFISLLKRYIENPSSQYKANVVRSVMYLHPFYIDNKDQLKACLDRTLFYIICENFGIERKQASDQSVSKKILDLFAGICFFPGNKDVALSDIHVFLNGDDLFSLCDLQRILKAKVVFFMNATNGTLSKFSQEERASLYADFLKKWYPNRSPDEDYGGRILLSYPSREKVSVHFSTDLSKGDQDIESVIDDLFHDSDAALTKDDIISSDESRTNETDDLFRMEYSISGLGNLLSLESAFMLQDHVILYRCESCGRLFPGTPENHRFCNVKDQSGISCLMKYEHRTNVQKLQKAYALAYRRLCRRYKNEKISERVFLDCKTGLRAMLEQAINDDISLQVFIDMIKKKEREICQ